MVPKPFAAGRIETKCELWTATGLRGRTVGAVAGLAVRLTG